MTSATTRREIPGWVPRDLFPFESKFVDIDGHSVHYIDEGSGPTILLVHGNPTWSFLYRDIVLQLKDQFRCIAVDHPGFGLSRAADGYDFLPASHAQILDRFVAALGLTDFLIMVQDWGGPIGLWVAGKRADQVRGLVIGNTWAWPIDGDKHFERFSSMMGGPVGGFFIRHFNAFVNMMIPMNVKRRKLSREVMGAYRGPFPTKDSRLPTRIFPREIRHSSAFLAEVEAGLDKLTAKPALIVWGDRDIAFRDKERERFEATFSSHRTMILEGAGHYIQEAAPDEIAEAIRDWWGNVDTRGQEGSSMTEPTERMEKLFFEVFEPLPRQGPGSRSSAKRALDLCTGLHPSPAILDLGSGAGAQTFHLAELTTGTITAIDSHAPNIERLRAEVTERGLGERIQPLVGDMAKPEHEPESFDLIWSEGALYNIGIEVALRLYHPVVKPDGYFAFTEAVWRKEDPPPEVKAAFGDYGGMGSARDVLAKIEASDFSLVDHFTLPYEDWWDNLYTPMERRIEELRGMYAGDAEALAALEEIAREPEMHRRHSDYYGYEFFVVRRGYRDR